MPSLTVDDVIDRVFSELVNAEGADTPVLDGIERLRAAVSDALSSLIAARVLVVTEDSKGNPPHLQGYRLRKELNLSTK